MGMVCMILAYPIGLEMRMISKLLGRDQDNVHLKSFYPTSLLFLACRNTQNSAKYLLHTFRMAGICAMIRKLQHV